MAQSLLTAARAPIQPRPQLLRPLKSISHLLPSKPLSLVLPICKSSSRSNQQDGFERTPARDSDIHRSRTSKKPKKERPGTSKQTKKERKQRRKNRLMVGLNMPVFSLPIIGLNARNLSINNKSALLSIPWQGTVAGLLGSLCLLTHLVKKKEKVASLIHLLFLLPFYVLLTQLALAGAIPLLYFAVTSVVIMFGLLLNFLNSFNMLRPEVWQLWENFTAIWGFSISSRLAWVLTTQLVPKTVFPDPQPLILAIVAVALVRLLDLADGLLDVGIYAGGFSTYFSVWSTMFLHE